MNLKFSFTRRLFYIAGIALATLLITAFFLLRGIMLHKAMASVNSRLMAHQYEAKWDNVRFRGIRTVFFGRLHIQHQSDPDELYIDSLSVRVRVMPLALKQIRISMLRGQVIRLNLHVADSVSDEKIIATGNDSLLTGKIKNNELAGFANRNIRRLFNFLPARVSMERMEMALTYNGTTTLAGFHNLKVKNGVMSAALIFEGDSAFAQIPVTGKFNRANSLMELEMINADTTLLPIPFLKDKFGIAAGFDSLHLKIDLASRNRHLVSPRGTFSFTRFELSGDRLSSQNIRINRFKTVFKANIGPDYLEIDSATIAEVNRIAFRPYLRLQLNPSPAVIFRLLNTKWNADDFFRSLPQGMFTSLIGMRATGSLQFFLDFSVDLKNLDSLSFHTRLTSDDFNIVGYGADDYRMLNGSFLHTAYERGIPVRSFKVGPENPDFVPLEQISPFVRAAVMTSEDGSFFYHKGFNPNAFRESMVTNLRERRFARGGSTISMQLVKNVFLTRNKTFSRKIEEAIIVWLIENERLVPKQRMYEVYLNIIEWGPGIYGINQAGRFYFNKSPAELNLNESVYLASIVPHPKWFKYTFETNGNPRPFFAVYFNRLKELMARREFISPSDTTGVLPVVMLTGPAATAFAPADTVVSDSLIFKELKMIERTNLF